MARRRSDQDRELQAVYERIPTPMCRGLCGQACGPIDASAREKQRLRARGIRLVPRAQALRELADTGSYRCPALTEQDQCAAYEDRPAICRLWGDHAEPAVPVRLSARPRAARRRERLQLLVQSLHAGGDTGQFGDGPVPTSEQVAAALAQPGARTAVHDLHRRPGALRQTRAGARLHRVPPPTVIDDPPDRRVLVAVADVVIGHVA